MLQTLSFGPLALPVAPVFAILAVMIGLDVAARFGRFFRLLADDTWNTGMIAIASCLIVARLSNIIQFWDIYASELSLIVSPRPSGFVWSVGLLGGIVGGYLYLLRRALAPLPVMISLCVGATTAWGVQSMANYLTGYLLGQRSSLPWSLPYYGELRHPVALYEMAGMLILLVLLFGFAKHQAVVAPTQAVAQRSVAQIFWLILVGWGTIFLITRGLVEEPLTFAGIRLVQVIALGVALLACWQLAQTQRGVRGEG